MKFDMNTINKYFSAQSANDLNAFIESMPMRAGYGVLIAAGIAWLLAGLAVVYATTVAANVAEIRTELIKTEALKPLVPKISEVAVPDDEIEKFVEMTNPLYQNVNISHDKNAIKFNANSGRFFGAFREAINHAYNGGQGWRLSLQSLCVGRECEKQGFLSGEFTVNRITVVR
jgi:hypothetical protein